MAPPDARFTDGPALRRGRLLVAAPTLVDPNFLRTVLLMLEHSDDGALGLVLNRPLPLRAQDALPQTLAALLDGEAVVHQGGPVQPEAVILLADFADPSRAASIAVDTVGVVDPHAEATDLDGATRRVRAFGGYAGWGVGQLEREIAEGAWIDAPATVTDVFCDDAEALWRRVLDRKGGAFRLLARMPDDPTMN